MEEMAGMVGAEEVAGRVAEEEPVELVVEETVMVEPAVTEEMAQGEAAEDRAARAATVEMEETVGAEPFTTRPMPRSKPDILSPLIRLRQAQVRIRLAPWPGELLVPVALEEPED